MISDSNFKDNGNGVIMLPEDHAFLTGSDAIVTFEKKEFTSPDKVDPITITVKGKNKSYKYIPWGADDNLPNRVAKTISKNTALARGTEFNITATFGAGLKPVLKNEDGTTSELPEDHEVKLFFEDNDINTWYLEQATDMHVYFNNFNQIILNESGDKILQLDHLEAMFSRLEEINEKGTIEHHFYSAKFGTEETITEKDVDLTPVLPTKFTYQTLMVKTGRSTDAICKDNGKRRYVIPVRFPVPGRVCYSIPYWYAILESGWIEFANAVPEFKKYMMKNQITIKYQIVISEDYFPIIFKAEGITDEKKKKARIEQEYESINKFLTDTKNTAKSWITYSKKYPGSKGYENLPLIKIEPIKNEFTGGEFIEDSAEANNIISYSIGVHPLITGASPSKNGTINGTEARELFNLKRALLFPYRWQILKILYFIKRYNNWQKNLYFAVEDVALTTLDKNKTGIETITTIYNN